MLTFQVGKPRKELQGGRRGSGKELCTCLAHRVLSKEGLARGVARVEDGILGHHTQRPELAGQETQ